MPADEPVDTDEEAEEEEVAEGEDGDFLVDFPDNTEVRIYASMHRLPYTLLCEINIPNPQCI